MMKFVYIIQLSIMMLSMVQFRDPKHLGREMLILHLALGLLAKPY
jgi:hypothetical protein